MPDYDLSRLSSRSFEQLLQALATKVLGPGIAIFGDGPDGGREATFHGKVPYPSKADGWDGYGVLQAKFLQRPRDVTIDGQWAIQQLQLEITKYLNDENNIRKPEYFIYATNVVLTPVREQGSKDRVVALLEEFKERLPLKGYDIWDYDKIRVFLDGNQEVRRTNAAWITSGDVFSEIMQRIESKSPDFQHTLQNFLQKELLADEFVNLEQAGHDVNEGIPLAHVFVDLPVVHEPHSNAAIEAAEASEYQVEDNAPNSPNNGFIKAMLSVSSERLAPQSLSSGALENAPGHSPSEPMRGRFVLIGGPGQGKTTVGQFICQIFRASIISRCATVTSPEIRRALSLITQHCQEEEIDLLLVPRFPFRIVLNEFASALSSDSLPKVNSVLSFMAHNIGKRTDRTVSVDDLRASLSLYPYTIVFDGLDEVPSSSNRNQVLEAIRDFWVDASNLNADILAIATTRPQGYNDDFSPALYHHQRLAPLSKDLGKHFARRLVDVRYGTDADRKEKVLGRLDRSFESDSTSRLMRSPLQITIMTALVDRLGQPPQARWNLFRAYYDVIYQREVERDIPASSILRLYQPDINAIHNRVGLLLQIDSERTGRTDAKFSTDRFTSLVELRLKEEGHEGTNLTNLTQQILDAAAQRLVFLVGLESNQVGFEIRSLQEFMAAESLMDGTEQDVERRLQEIAPLPNWRNVFLFASGKCFSERQHLRDTIHRICATLNETAEDEVAGNYLVGSGLAMDLLEDGLCRHQPKFVHSLARIAVRALDLPNDGFQNQLAAVYEEQLRPIFIEELSRRLKDENESVRLGTWNCLIRLVALDVDWARQLANEQWPPDSDLQLNILQACGGFWGTSWSAAKFIELMPQYSLTQMRETFHVGTMKAYENKGYHRIDEATPKGLDMLPRQEAMIKLLHHGSYERGAEFELLGERFCGLSTLQTPEDQSYWLFQLRDLRDCHGSWVACQSAVSFLQNPTSATLAQQLRRVAPHITGEVHPRWYWWQTQMPWPLAACLDMCVEEKDALDLARKAETGQLGDRELWLAAEHRWRTVGVTEDDLKSMSDERLPFDGKIDSEGFPVSLSIWPLNRPSSEDGGAFGTLLTLHGGMESTRTRTLVAGLVEACFVCASLYFDPDGMKYPIALDLGTLQSVLEDLPVGRPLPLHSVVHLISEADEQLSDFFRTLNRRQVDFSVYNFRGIFQRDALNRLERVFAARPDDDILLPVFGALAENGQLPSNFIKVASPDHFEDVEQKIGSLVINLAQESWETDKTSLLIASVKEISKLVTAEQLHTKIIDTLSGRVTFGMYFEKFLVEFGKLFSTDSYRLRKRYALLLQDALSRRTSRFANVATLNSFRLPPGITELL